MSRILIGTDEAGYGPNLGPLVVTATAWECPNELNPESLWDALGSVVTNETSKRSKRLYVTDSKAVYGSGDSLEDLEVPVLAFLQTLKLTPASVQQLGEFLGGSRFLSQYAREPWNAQSAALPTASSPDHIEEWSQTLESEMQQTGIRLVGIRCGFLFPEEFNHQVRKTDSKGSVLSGTTLELVRSLSEMAAGRSVQVVCDKHGGRNRYDELIAGHFDDQFVFRMEESRDRSRYRMGNMEFCFRTKAEALLPVALASMCAKYLRELLMHQFNAWWCHRVPGLRPTQGYPVDAKRFRADIEGELQSIGLCEEQIWRSR